MAMNEELALRVLQELIHHGVKEFCVCPGGRNAPFCAILEQNSQIKTYYWHEERSAAFFANGRSQATQNPVPVIVTSGTAAGELLPATMEAYYSGIPLVLVTADRPRNLRNTGAPQVAEQVGLFGCYVRHCYDLADAEEFDLGLWKQDGPCHINVCFDEPRSPSQHYALSPPQPQKATIPSSEANDLKAFLLAHNRPLVILSTLKETAKEPIVQFLLKLNAPIYLEGISNLREDPRLAHLRCYSPDIQNCACDCVLRIGGIPTHRVWRDLEKDSLPVFSISETPFPGLSHGTLLRAQLEHFFSQFEDVEEKSFDQRFTSQNQQYKNELEALLIEEPLAEPSLLRALSEFIPPKAHIYLGNSMPIRNWDLAATNDFKQFKMRATRGLNGIDGQLSCFFGLTEAHVSNWAILGDLTTLYDLSAPWILPQIEAKEIKIVVINNFGGGIFARKFQEKCLQNAHRTQFKHFAALWDLAYEKWDRIPKKGGRGKRMLIELCPNIESTERFWNKFSEIKKRACSAAFH
ncbi:2-succinyl-5-enolpyruvyl-6-hydroxy-3- cyclohexene-1-carboxylate synthase [Chlamydiales bacterium STE3]|nr:2-succinyl-5-enolpyruvyl-6-hydroxy-3- cyclohexene-1-carboxylate synthase [Chlamydiales bacterium STE3]